LGEPEDQAAEKGDDCYEFYLFYHVPDTNFSGLVAVSLAITTDPMIVKNTQFRVYTENSEKQYQITTRKIPA
jgi:hypothetical protein